ncbi:porin family protein [Bdellovibrio bacteriovorus]|uniref:porin family protein n=1 Tax=Bdellovibrio bacteriovorus TaxID=959 RepID=UPI0021D0E21B|nr:porin family protein [Bdellovibrio bacteriovorus]UXR65520.1 porin family protein [Bdellovibrio bacteriovorus]
MKYFMALMAGLLITLGISTLAQAQTVEDIKNGTNQVKLMVGSTQAAVNFGLEYEHRTGTFGLGAMLMHSTKNSDANKPESTTLGANITSHLYDQNDLDIYIAPGLAVTNMDQIAAGGDDETLFGPTLTLGATYTLNKQWGVGLEYLSLYNWFSDKTADHYNFANAVVSYNF